jgi:hypothetical protein
MTGGRWETNSLKDRRSSNGRSRRVYARPRRGKRRSGLARGSSSSTSGSTVDWSVLPTRKSGGCLLRSG